MEPAIAGLGQPGEEDGLVVSRGRPFPEREGEGFLAAFEPLRPAVQPRDGVADVRAGSLRANVDDCCAEQQLGMARSCQPAAARTTTPALAAGPPNQASVAAPATAASATAASSGPPARRRTVVSIGTSSSEGGTVGAVMGAWSGVGTRGLAGARSSYRRAGDIL